MLSNLIKNKDFLKFSVYFYLFVTSYFTCKIFTGIVKNLAIKYGILDQPGDRKVHSTAKPLCGGLALLFTIVFIVGFNLFLFYIVIKTGYFKTLPEWITKNHAYFIKALPQLMGLMSGMIIITFVGFVDDVKGLGPKVKFAFQIIVALIAVFSGVKITVFEIPYINEFISVLWIVGITNAFNLLDNMDGLSGGVAAIIAFSICVVAISMGQFFVALITITLMGTLMGFLKHNFAPATIFMGDTGALLLGYMLATISIVTTFYTKGMPNYFAIMIPLLLMITPLFDTFSVMFIRLKNRKSLFVGDKNHFSHRLNALGFSKRASVIVVYILTIISSLSAVLLTCANSMGAYLIILQLIFLICLTIVLMLGKNLERD